MFEKFRPKYTSDIEYWNFNWVGVAINNYVEKDHIFCQFTITKHGIENDLLHYTKHNMNIVHAQLQQKLPLIKI